MTDNEKLAVWQGWQNDATLGWCRPIGKSGSWFAEVDFPDYLNDDAAAMSLLNTLVEKGYDIQLINIGNSWLLNMSYRPKMSRILSNKVCSTINEALVAACLEVICKEDV